MSDLTCKVIVMSFCHDSGVKTKSPIEIEYADHSRLRLREALELWCKKSGLDFADNIFELNRSYTEAVPALAHIGRYLNLTVCRRDATTRVELVWDDAPDKVFYTAVSANETIGDVLARYVAFVKVDPLDVRLRFIRHEKMSARRLALDQEETPELNQAPNAARVRLVRVTEAQRRLEQIAALHAATAESVDQKRKLDELERAHLAVQRTCMDQHAENSARVRRLERDIAKATAALKAGQRQLAKAKQAHEAGLADHPVIVASSRQAVSDAAAAHTASEQRREELHSAFVRRTKCAVCFEPNAGDDVLQPCGHMIACRPCSGKLVGGPCPVCRAHVASAQRVFHG
jgi:hypothetical protein